MTKTDDIRRSIESQISDLQKQLHSLRGDLSERGHEFYDVAQDHANVAAKQFRTQARVMGDVARENPGSAATVLSVVALTCLGLGYLAGRSSAEDNW
ncbi:hypothetical protein CDV50_05250 [Haematobacter massiliensis]|uniref:Uncharacterized protein n=1 Tax=Haematobacter massiliensis TaxID=195105 RepID=A0A086YCG2_9RHOB|nr:hypothetical protein [Haematobacter massiliensis]KFI31962.1 hypothetical protein CN97_05985 [Haematobacter massiliensis]OWJ72573.1 hypothetical protein CDV50_05250 [Haematobacter massiliensis]OWJ87912.1 hypothetical protein CDV51_05070 [Haematobacter massiliensis]QBJ24351.1 hypothetical protein HmaOT1_08845 [Haematobacter massiliensis]